MRSNLKAFVLFAFVFSLFACSSGDTEEFRTAVYVNDLDIVSIAIDVAENQDTLDVNDPEAQLVLPVIATLGDGSTTPVSRFLQWSSSDQGVISVNGSGIARPVATGDATITAPLGDFSDSIELEASDAPLVSIAITPSGTPLICSFDTTLSAIGTYQNEGEEPDERDITHRVTWSSEDEAVATVQSNANGQPTILAKSNGPANLSASRGLITSPPLLVTIEPGNLASIALTPPSVSNLEEGESQRFVATGTYTNTATKDVTQASTWTSSNPTNLANASTKGVFNALQEGNVTVTAACGGVTSAPATVTVIEPRTITDIEIRDQNNVRTNLIEKDPTALNFQLHARLIYSDDTYEDVTNEDDTDWTIKSSTVNGVLTVGNDDDLDNKGEVELLGPEGRVVIEVRAEGEEDEITIDVDFDHD